MNGNRHRCLLLLVLLAGLPLGAFSLDLPPFEGLTDARAMALGGPYVAVADDFSSMFANPASLASPTPTFSAARLDLGVSGPVFGIASSVLSGTSGADAIAIVQNILSANAYKLYAGIDVSGPLSIGYKGEGLGFGAFMKTHFAADVGSVSSITLGLSEDLLVTGGYAFRIKIGKRSALDMGLLAKGFIRGSLDVTGGLVDILPLATNPMAILGKPFTLTSGVGLDVGARWNWAEILALGLSCTDAFSPALEYTYSNVQNFVDNSESPTPVKAIVPPNLKAGLMIRPPLGFLGRVFDDILITADYERLLDLLDLAYRNPILNVKVGLELRVLEVLIVRAGIAEGLLHMGAEFDLGFVRLSASAWGEELGWEPGARPIYNFLLGIDFVY